MYELERVCDGFLCSMSSTYDGAVLLYSKATLSERSFSLASSSVWNSVPYDVRCAPSLSSSKSRLKTYLFRLAYIY